MSKIITTISLFIFWAFVTGLFVAGLISYQNNKIVVTSNNVPNLNNLVSNSVSVNNAIKAGKTITLNLNEISKHNSTNECWLLIDSKVYDVTSFLNSHPGGAGTIIPYCGKEATNAFNTKDVGRPHSNRAVSMLTEYFIGNLNQSIGPTTIKKVVSTNPPTITNPIIVSTSTQSPMSAQTSTTIVLNSIEVAKHNSVSDCWLIINNKIYSVSSYLSSHPGGVNTIVFYCGRDATAAFNTKGGSGHSSYANSLLSQYYVGDLNQTASTQQIQQNIQNTNTVPPPTGGGGREVDD